MIGMSIRDDEIARDPEKIACGERAIHQRRVFGDGEGD
jgi:hypothetical protein